MSFVYGPARTPDTFPPMIRSFSLACGITLLSLGVLGCGDDAKTTSAPSPQAATVTTSAPPPTTSAQTVDAARQPDVATLLSSAMPVLPDGQDCDSPEQVEASSLDGMIAPGAPTPKAAIGIKCNGQDLEYLAVAEMASPEEAATAARTATQDRLTRLQNDPRKDKLGTNVPATRTGPSGTTCVTQIDDDDDFRPYSHCVAATGRYVLVAGSEDYPPSPTPRSAEPGITFLQDWVDGASS